jgi:hypothetical protein
MMNMNDKIPSDGPFLALDREGFACVIKLKGGRTSCTRTAYKTGYFEDLDIYDIRRNWYKIRAARLVESSIWKKSVSLFFSVILAVDLTIEFQRKLDQSDIIKIVVDSVRKDEEFWSSGREVDDMIEEIRNTRDMHGIMSVLGGPVLT